MKSSMRVLAALGLLGAVAPVAVAQDGNYRPSINTDLIGFERGGIVISDAIKIKPRATLKVGVDDNAGKTPDIPNPGVAGQQRDGSVFDFRAGLDFTIAPKSFTDGSTKIVVSVDTNALNYSSSNLDNNSTSSVGVKVQSRLSSRLDTLSSLKYTDGEDPRGSINDNRQVNSYEKTDVKLAMGYGAPGAKGRFELDLDFSNKEYDADPTNPPLQAQDVQKAGVTPRFFWRVAPKTRVFVEGNLTTNEYVRDLLVGSPELDSTDTRLSVGAKWDATAKTSGSVNIGSKRRDYDVPDATVGRVDSNEGFWDISATLNATAQASFTASTGSDFADNFQNSGQQTTRFYSIAWKHNWMDRVSSRLSYRYTDDDYVGFRNPVANTLVNRQDETDMITLTVDYQMREWLKLGGEVRYEDRDSNLKGNTLGDNFTYDRSLFLLTASAVF